MKETMLYLDCSSGISGDMMTAALLDLGADQEGLLKVLQSIPVKGFEIKISRVKKAGLDACDFDVKLDKAHENHDHDMEYLYGKKGETLPVHDEAGHHHEHEHYEHEYHEYEHHEHEHQEYKHHEHEHHGHGHSHEHRGLLEILEIIGKTEMPETAKKLAEKIFGILAEAEAKAHGVPLEQVHFHEVGAVDSIVDIIAAAFCLDDLGVKQTVIPVLCEGQGMVRCQHGLLPVPVPAVSNIVKDSGLPLQITETKGELVTPTGAAIAAAICTEVKLPERFFIDRIGLGAGKRVYDRPGILRAMMIRPAAEKPAGTTDRICRLETNLDDCTGENMGYVMDILLKAGAKDVSYTPIFMKKNRPAYQLNVICDPKDRETMEGILFRETTSIGVRGVEMDRSILNRKTGMIRTPLGDAAFKECSLLDGTIRRYPEYESAAALAEANGISFYQAFHKICKYLEEE